MEPIIRGRLGPWKYGTCGWLRAPAIRTCLLVGLGLLFSLASPAADESLEYPVKAAFLLNFTKFIEWPQTAFDAPNSPIAICILGDDPFDGTLDQIVAGEIVNGRMVTVPRIRRPPPPKACQVLFVGRPEKEILSLLAATGPGVLTVGDGESFIRDGGMIAFVIENRRVRFIANQTAAEHSGLKISSRLLSVARSVKK